MNDIHENHLLTSPTLGFSLIPYKTQIKSQEIKIKSQIKKNKSTDRQTNRMKVPQVFFWDRTTLHLFVNLLK